MSDKTIYAPFKTRLKKLCDPALYGSKAALVTIAVLGATNPAYAQTSEGLEELVVTGTRGALRHALDVKRNADAIVDAISAEDIGKFPDKNVADSLQRVPGISVDRIWGEGRDLFVRGTDSTLNRTLMNGQNVASAFWWANDNPSRGFNYSMLASELVSRLEVYKSPEANIDEGSIGGTVIVRTRKPLDLDNLTLQTSFEAQYSDLPDEVDPQISGLFSWKNDDENFGILVSTNRQERTVRRDGLEAFPTNTLYDVTDQNGDVTSDVYVPWGGGSAIFQQSRERTTNNLTVQYKPSDRLDLSMNYVDSDMDMDNSNQNYLFVSGGLKVAGGDTVTNPVFIPTADGNQALVGGTFENPNSIGVADEPIIREAFVKSEVLDFEANYEGDGWNLHAQLGRTEASGGSTKDRNYWFQGNTRQTLNLGPNTNEFGFLDIDPLNGSDLRLDAGSLRDWVRIMEDEETYAQADVTFDVEWGAVNSFDVGLKLRDHTIINNRTTASIDTSDPALADLVSQINAITLADVSNGPSPTLHGETATAGSLTSYAFLDNGLAAQRIDSLTDQAFTYTPDNNAFFDINEEITAAYAKANFETEQLRGNFGVRVVKTDQTSTAFIDGQLGSVGRSYTEVLPSLNVVYNLSDDLIIRGAVSKAMARPTFQNLSSNLVINATSGTASAGNPNLEPTFANQFEIGAEWYFGEDDLLSATYFQKDLDTFIGSRTASETINGQTINVTRPFNAENGADIKGIEAQIQKFFTDNIGMTANLTLTDANSATPGLELPGNSDTQGNLSFFYESELFSARLSYNFRSEAFGGLVSGSQIVTEDYDQWDFNATWYATEKVDVFVNAVNLTNEVIFQRTSDGIPVGLYENGPRFSVGARIDF